MEVKILNYGGTITNIFAPDKNNNREDIVLGFDTFEGKISETHPYLHYCNFGKVSSEKK